MLPAVLLVLVGGEWIADDTERFGRVVVAGTLVLGAALISAKPRAWPWALSVAFVAAALLPGSPAEAALAVASVLLAAATVSVLWVVASEGSVGPVTRAPAVTPRIIWCTPTGFGPARWPRWVGDWGVPVGAWFAVSVVVNLTLSVSAAIVGTADGRIVWDASNFLAIAREGYVADPRLAASFPGYAMLIRAAHEWLGVDHELAAILLSNLAGVATAVLFWRWAGGWLPARARWVSLGLMLCFPYAFVLYGVAYADGVLLALVLGALLAIELDRPLVAGLIGAAATFTRPNGLVLVPTLIVLVAERSGVLDLDGFRRPGRSLREQLRDVRVHGGSLRPRHAAVLLSVVGISGLMVWMWSLFDDPLFFWSVQVGDYGHRAFADPATWFKVEFINRPWEFVHNTPDMVNQVVSLAIVLAALWSLPSVGRRYGWGYSVLGLSSVAVLWVTATGFSPAGRYLLTFVPVLVIWCAEPLSRRPRVAIGVIATGMVWSCALAAGFAAGARFNW